VFAVLAAISQPVCFVVVRERDKTLLSEGICEFYFSIKPGNDG
jgi:hypothetical protein